MKTIVFRQQPLKTRGINHRQGSFRYVELGEGSPGTPENFNLRWVLSEPDFFSPRHRHNFDQARVQLRGEFSFDEDGRMTPGTAGFFPEGTFYGPQTSRSDTVQLVMQIGGASGNGYLSERERIDAVAQLAERGEFRSGHYFPHEGGEASRVDGFQAAWEFARGRAMLYPAQRFSRPLICDPDAIDWVSDPDRAGVSHKTLWDFGPRTVGLKLLRMTQGSRIVFNGPITAFVSAGRCRVADQTGQMAQLGKCDVVQVSRSDLVSCEAKAGSELIVFVHPVFGAAT